MNSLKENNVIFSFRNRNFLEAVHEDYLRINWLKDHSHNDFHWGKNFKESLSFLEEIVSCRTRFLPSSRELGFFCHPFRHSYRIEHRWSNTDEEQHLCSLEPRFVENIKFASWSLLYYKLFFLFMLRKEYYLMMCHRKICQRWLDRF